MRFRKDRNMARNLLRQPDVKALVDEATEAVADKVATLASEVSERYEVHTESHVDKTRAFGRVVVEHPAWIPIEFGTRKTPAHAPLRRGLEASGLRSYSKGRR